MQENIQPTSSTAEQAPPGRGAPPRGAGHRPAPCFFMHPGAERPPFRENAPKLDNFSFTGYQETDRAFAAFTQMLEELDEPTVVLMFGDHLPSVEEEFLNAVLDAGDPFARRTTPFVLWANYDADFSAFESGMTLSSNYLAPMLVQAAGLPMTGMQKLLWQLHSEYPVVSNVGLMAADGTFIPPEEGVALPAIHDYSMLEYNYLKGCREMPEFYALAQE